MWVLFGLLAAAALCFSFTPSPAWRVVSAVAGVMLAWLPGFAVLAGKGPLAVRRIEWEANGEWHWIRSDGRPETGRLVGATATLGPWILLAWSVQASVWSLLGRRYALIGVSQVTPQAFRALKGRLSLPERHHSGPASP